MLKRRFIRLLKDLDIYYETISCLNKFKTLDCVVIKYILAQLRWSLNGGQFNHIKRWLNVEKWDEYVGYKSYIIPYPDKDEERKELWDYLKNNGITWCHGRSIYEHQPTPIHWICVELNREGISYSSGIDTPAPWVLGSVIDCENHTDFINRYEKLKAKINKHANEVIELPSELSMKMNRKK